MGNEKRIALIARAEHERSIKEAQLRAFQVLQFTQQQQAQIKDLIIYVELYQLRFRLTMAIAAGLGIALIGYIVRSW